MGSDPDPGRRQENLKTTALLVFQVLNFVLNALRLWREWLD